MDKTTTPDPTIKDQIIMNFSHLPLDIHTLIFEMLSPSDIIRLRKMCKAMFDATSQRIVWLKALERMCHDNTVYRHSFPIDNMSLLELEYAAIAPKIWESLALRADSSCKTEFSSFATHILQPQYETPFDFQTEDLYLIPGGRFLIILQRGYMNLWDLGYTSAIGALRAEMKPIARIETSCTSYTVHTSRDGSALQVLAVTRQSIEESFTKYQYDVLEIFPWKSNPEFTTIATMSITSHYHLDYTSICGDRLTLVYGPIIKIWDFMADEWATWNTSNFHQQILMTDQTIVLIGKQDLSLWDVPKLSPDAQTQSTKPEPTTPSHPRRMLTYEEGHTPPENFSCWGLCDWYTGSPQPLWFDLENSEERELSRYEADISDLQPVKIPIKSLPSFQLPATDDTFLSPYRVCGQSIVIPWSTSGGIYAHIGPSSSLDTRNHVATLRLIEDIVPREVSFCPISGRLAYISPSREEIEIIDFLPPTDVSQDTDRR